MREDGFRVCFVVDHYPAVSHTLVLREVEALRRAGPTVETVALHDSPDQVLAGPDLGGPGSSWGVSAHSGDVYTTSRPLLSEKARRATAIAGVSDFGRGQSLALVGEEHWGKIRVVHSAQQLRALLTGAAGKAPA